MNVQLPFYLFTIIRFTFVTITLIVVVRLIMYLLTRMWRKQKYKLVWTSIYSVDRRSNLSYDEFVREYASVGKPVIITDAMKDWKASTKWTLDFFRSECASISVGDFGVENPLMDMTVAEYLDRTTAADCDKFLYRAWPISSFPKLYEDYKVPVYFHDWLPRLPQKPLNNYFGYLLTILFIGAKDTSIGLHKDGLDMPSWIALISGRKKIVLFTPDQEDFLYNGQVDVFNPDYKKFPLYVNTTPVEVNLEAGEIIFVPIRWFHHVINIENSISLASNFINEWCSEIVFEAVRNEAPIKGKILPLILEFPLIGKALSTTGLL
ncbi:cupin-like domain-containing protein [Nostoc sp.]|uniref:cupin-like domain-containing protein n=1 Tax=Nostoc sp. TaxID=1180 RepID=UPI002FFC244F